MGSRALALCAALTALGSSEGAHAQSGGGRGLAQLLAGLEGTWEGTGVLLGRPATFSMEWRLDDEGFAHLAYENRWLEADGSATPVLVARATYLMQGDSAIGVWVDHRPARITLRAVATDSSVVTEWTAERERGRTEYVLRSRTEAGARDHVVVDGVERPFGEASYRRTRDAGR